MPERYAERSTRASPPSAPPPTGASSAAGSSGSAPGPARDALGRRRATQTSAPARIAAATGSRLTGPIRGARSAVTVGPTSAPALPPAAMKPNSRRACSSRHTSAMKLQNTDTTKRLKTLSQMKKAPRRASRHAVISFRRSRQSPRETGRKSFGVDGLDILSPTMGRRRVTACRRGRPRLAPPLLLSGVMKPRPAGSATRTPLVSICVPAYNGARFLRECLESALAQTCADFEILVVDDSSGDNTAALARDYPRRFPRVRVHVNERNLGLVANWNRYVELAPGAC